MDYSFLKKDLMIYRWAECEETTNSSENKPKSVFLEYDGTVKQEQLTAFLQAVAPQLHRVKGFCKLEGCGWNQVDVVGALIDYKPSERFEKSQLVFISKVGPAVIKTILDAWKANVDTQMKLKN